MGLREWVGARVKETPGSTVHLLPWGDQATGPRQTPALPVQGLDFQPREP